MYANTLKAHIGIQQDQIEESANLKIVKNILNYLLHSREHENKLCLFQKRNQVKVEYNLQLGQRICFNIVVGQVQHEISLQAAMLCLRDLRSSAKLAFLGNIYVETFLCTFKCLSHVTSASLNLRD